MSIMHVISVSNCLQLRFKFKMKIIFVILFSDQHFLKLKQDTNKIMNKLRSQSTNGIRLFSERGWNIENPWFNQV